MGKAAFLLGGLLGGLGEGMVRNGAAKREATLRMLDQQHDEMMLQLRGDQDREGREFSADRDDARTDRDNAADDAREDKRQQSEDARADKDRQFRYDELDARKNGLLREGDDDDLVEVADPDNPGRTKMVPKSQASGMPGKGSADALLGEQSDRESAAEDQAIAEADEKAGYFSTDASDFAEDGGSREAFIARRKKEILDGKATDTKRTPDQGDEAAGGGGGADPADEQEPADQDATPLPTDRKQLQVGVIYQTKRGKAKYLGNGQFEAVE